MAERWLLTGGTGQVGHALREAAPAGVELVAPTRAQLNLAALPDLTGWLEGVTAIVNCGAYTAVDRAESEPDLARAINADAPARLAAAATRARIPLIHVSTDYVFAADGTGPWREDAPIAPGSVYGRTKADGESAVRDSGARHAIVRAAWVFGAHGQNFVKTMLRLGAERKELRVVADQRGTPTHAGDLAAALVRITARLAADPALPSGTWHCANAGEATWHALASEVFACAARHGLPVPGRVIPIATADYPTPALRPADSRLDCNRIVKDFGISLPPWQDAVARTVAQLAPKGPPA